MHPSGVNFEAVGQLKAKVDSRDPYYIYRVNDRKLNQQESFVFKTSRTQAKIALSMDRHGQGVLNKEYCFMDVKHNRCSSFKTFSIHVYHPMLRKIITLATMECESETADTLSKFWMLFNEVLQKVAGDSTTKFNPLGWMADEAGANWSAIAKTFGQDALDRTVGCQFHFKQSVNRHANKLTSDKSKAKLKQLADCLMQATTASLYNACLDKMRDFISEKPHKRSFLDSWLNWWNLRRTHVFKAFRPSDNAPTTNLAESVHSVWKNTRATNITLVDAAYHDIAEAIHIERQIENYKSGLYRGGTGPSAYSRQEHNYYSQMRRAEQYASEVLKTATSEGNSGGNVYLLDPHCSHRPTRPSKRQFNSNAKKEKQPKKARISSHLQNSEIEQLSSSSSEELSLPPKDKRNARYRGQRSKAFEVSLAKAKQVRRTLQLTQVMDLGEERVYSITRAVYAHENEAPTYYVKIGKDPSCSCPYSQKTTNICKHRLWVLLFLFEVEEDSYLLHQKAFTPTEVKEMFQRYKPPHFRTLLKVQTSNNQPIKH
jgi:hypothetical protein